MSKKEKENKEKQAESKAEEVKAEPAAEKKAKKKAEETTEESNSLEEELAAVKDHLLRVTAEYANFRKRSEKEKQDAFTFAKAQTVKELLPAVDNLERAIANGKEDFEGLKKGIEMTYESLINILGKLGVEIFGKAGETFDPNLHNAVMHVEDEAFKDGEIVEVFQKGYKINDKIIRPAMVKSAN